MGTLKPRLATLLDRLLVVDGECELTMHCNRDRRTFANSQAFGRQLGEQLHLRQVIDADLFEVSGPKMLAPAAAVVRDNEL